MAYYDSNIPDPDVTECFASPGGQELTADTFIPARNRQNRAAVVLVHGGGWRGGKRQAFRWHAHRLSLHGYVACTIDYRLSDTAPFPAALEDCQSAVRWLREHAARFDIASDRIGVLGSSAGGHLSACLGVFDNQEGNTSSRANCVVDIHGVHDFVSIPGSNDKLDQICEAFLGGAISEKRDLWIQASPAMHVNGDTAPMLLVHDPEDGTVPFDQTVILANALIRNGRPVQFMPSPGSGHGFVYDPRNRWTQQVWPVAVEWLDHHLLGARAPGLFEAEATEWDAENAEPSG